MQLRLMDNRRSVVTFLRLLYLLVITSLLISTPGYSTELAVDDILLAVKTSGKNHESRIAVLLKTWFTESPSRIFLFSDYNDTSLRKHIGSQLVITSCGNSHRRTDLCCKTGHALEMLSDILGSHRAPRTKWLCVVDDDTYVNLDVLRQVLNAHSSDESQPMYLGKPSVAKKVDLPPMYSRNFPETAVKKFWFATGGAGICLNGAASSKLRAYLAKVQVPTNTPSHASSALADVCNRLGVPDDMALGVIFEALLNVQLEVSNKFHSHLEFLEGIESPLEQATLSYNGGNRVGEKFLKSIFSLQLDPTRFLTLHCALHPRLTWCPE